jgi:predicted component of type VI protein secretion system
VRRRLFLLAAAVCLAGCATAPEEKKRRLTGADIFAVDPAVLRAAVLTDARVMIQAVVIDVRSPALDERFVLRLQQPAAIDRGLPPPADGLAWRVLGLSAEERRTLLTVRQMLASRLPGPEGLAVTVSAQPALVPAELIAALPVRIDLLVDNREGWFTLGEGTLDLRR